MLSLTKKNLWRLIYKTPKSSRYLIDAHVIRSIIRIKKMPGSATKEQVLYMSPVSTAICLVHVLLQGACHCNVQLIWFLFWEFFDCLYYKSSVILLYFKHFFFFCIIFIVFLKYRDIACLQKQQYPKLKMVICINLGL